MHRLHLSHRVWVRLHCHCQHHLYQNYENALRFHFHLFGGILDKEASLSFWVFLGCVCFFWLCFGCDAKEEVRGRGRGRGESWIEGLFLLRKGGVREWLSGVQV